MKKKNRSLLALLLISGGIYAYYVWKMKQKKKKKSFVVIEQGPQKINGKEYIVTGKVVNVRETANGKVITQVKAGYKFGGYPDKDPNWVQILAAPDPSLVGNFIAAKLAKASGKDYIM